MYITIRLGKNKGRNVWQGTQSAVNGRNEGGEETIILYLTYFM
jgi:hypothetical protein